MLPAPSTSSNRNDMPWKPVLRRTKPYRRHILFGAIVLLILYKFTNLFGSSTAAYEGNYDPVVSDDDSYAAALRAHALAADSLANSNIPPPHVQGKPIKQSELNDRLEQLGGQGSGALDQFAFAGRKRPSRGRSREPVDERGCPLYDSYSAVRHPPFSSGALGLPFQRPEEKCRTFQSDVVEQVIDDMTSRFADADLARLFENCFPNTLDTTIRWHSTGVDPQTFIVTGDINAEWLRDSQKQIAPYLPLAKNDPKIQQLFKGAINTQIDYVIAHPYCNAFQPPSQSGISFQYNNEGDVVFPRINLATVFECKYEIDSLASFLALSNDYYTATGDSSFLTASWFKALARLLKTLAEQAVPTFDEEGHKEHNYYVFKRKADTGTETLNLQGAGNPVNRNTKLIRSAFRPSDDATIYQFFIPGNAFMSVELSKTAKMLKDLNLKEKIAANVEKLAEDIKSGIYAHGVYEHPVFGRVFAYEVDGYGSVSIMDDANTPSLLSLPDMGFVAKDDPIYLNTRKMILSKDGNPYYLTGDFFEGIGGPHIGTRFAWPMSHLIGIRTASSDEEISKSLEIVRKSTGGLGLMHESVNVDLPHSYTRSWFAWCNSEFAKTMLYLAEHRPHLIFGDNAEPYLAGNTIALKKNKAAGGTTAGQKNRVSKFDAMVDAEGAKGQDATEVEGVKRSLPGDDEAVLFEPEESTPDMDAAPAMQKNRVSKFDAMVDAEGRKDEDEDFIEGIKRSLSGEDEKVLFEGEDAPDNEPLIF